ncbi:hypothetical protein PINS_up023313 [Pythium insidiosum]|nr:hypothetical protein PINS_up023313 [Pythium insidiosum]
MEEYQDCFKNLLSQTLEHFLNGLRDNLEHLAKNDELRGLSVDAVMGTCAEVLSLEFFGCIVGMFEMNNISLEVDHPFHTLSEALSDAAADKSRELPASLTKVQTALQKFALKHQHSCCDHDHEHGDEHAHDHAHDTRARPPSPPSSPPRTRQPRDRRRGRRDRRVLRRRRAGLCGCRRHGAVHGHLHDEPQLRPQLHGHLHEGWQGAGLRRAGDQRTCCCCWW